MHTKIRYTVLSNNSLIIHSTCIQYIRQLGDSWRQCINYLSSRNLIINHNSILQSEKRLFQKRNKWSYTWGSDIVMVAVTGWMAVRNSCHSGPMGLQGHIGSTIWGSGRPTIRPVRLLPQETYRITVSCLQGLSVSLQPTLHSPAFL